MLKLLGADCKEIRVKFFSEFLELFFKFFLIHCKIDGKPESRIIIKVWWKILQGSAGKTKKVRNQFDVAPFT